MQHSKRCSPFENTGNLGMAALKDAGPGYRDVPKAAGTFRYHGFSGIKIPDEAATEVRHLGESVRFAALVDYVKSCSFLDLQCVGFEVPPPVYLRAGKAGTWLRGGREGRRSAFSAQATAYAFGAKIRFTIRHGDSSRWLAGNDEAFAWLERAFEQRSLWLGYLCVEPQLDALRADPRFPELLRRVGFAQ